MSRRFKSLCSTLLAFVMALQLTGLSFAENDEEPVLDEATKVLVAVMVETDEDGVVPFEEEYEDPAGEQGEEAQGEQGDHLNQDNGEEQGQEGQEPQKTEEELREERLIAALDVVAAREGYKRLEKAALIDRIVHVETVGKLLAEGLTISPPEGYAVTGLELIPLYDPDREQSDPEENPESEGDKDEAGGEGESGNAESGNLEIGDPPLPVLFEKATATGEGPAIALTAEDFEGMFPITDADAYGLVIHVQKTECIEKVDATCAATGSEQVYKIGERIFADAACKTPLVEIPVIEKLTTHSDVTEHALVGANCAQTGTEAYWKCNTCGKLFSDEACTTEIDAPVSIAVNDEHNLVKHNAVQNTCKDEGNIEYWACLRCGKVFKDANASEEIELADTVLPANAAHSLGKVSAKPATCAEEGHEEYWRCLICDKLFADENGTTEIEAPTKINKLTTHPSDLIHHAKIEPTEETEGVGEYWECPVCHALFGDAAGTKPMTAVVTYPAIGVTAYMVLGEGTDTSWVKGSNKPATIHIAADYASDAVKSVAVNGSPISKESYNVLSGSVVVLLSKEYLNTLTAGKYTVLVTFESGKTASHEILISDPVPVKTKLVIKPDEKGLTKVYDGTSFDINGIGPYLTIENLPSGYKAIVDIAFEDANVSEIHNVGSASIKISIKRVLNADGEEASPDFEWDNLTGVKITITKRKIALQTKDDSKVYDGKVWTYQHMRDAQPVMAYTDPKLGEYTRGGNVYKQIISMSYTESPKEIGEYDNKAKLIIREKDAAGNLTEVTDNYEITYKFGKIKITDEYGRIPNDLSPKTGDENNVAVWVLLMSVSLICIIPLTKKYARGKL